MSGFGYGSQFHEEPFFKVSRIIGMLFVSMLIRVKKAIRTAVKAVLSAILGVMFVPFLVPVFIFFRDTDEKNFEFSLLALGFYWAILGLFFFVFLALS